MSEESGQHRDEGFVRGAFDGGRSEPYEQRVAPCTGDPRPASPRDDPDTEAHARRRLGEGDHVVREVTLSFLS